MKAELEIHGEIDEYFMILPQEISEQLGIEEGDSLTWVIDEEEIYIRKNSS